MKAFKWIPLLVLVLGFPLALVYLVSLPSMQFPQVTAKPVILALVVHVAAIALLILIWKGMLWQGARVEITAMEGLAHISQTLMGKYLPGKLWGFFARGVMLKGKLPSVTDNVVISVVEQITLLHAAAVCCGVFSAIYGSLIYGHWQLGLLAVMLILGSVAGVAVGLVWVKGFSADILRLFKVTAVKSSEVWAKLAGRRYIKNVALLSLYWILLTFIIVALFWPWFYGGVMDVAFCAKLALVLVAVPAGVVTGFLVLWVPSGIGVREGVIVAILALGFPMEQAVMISMAYRVWCVLADFVIGFSGVFLTRKYA